MDDTNLTAEEERQLRDVLTEAPADLKDGFCRCWPAVKKLLEWLSGKLPAGKLKNGVDLLIRVGEGAYVALGCDKAKPSTA